MPRGQFRTSMATATTARPLDGWQYEFLHFDAMVEIGVQSNVNLVVATIYSGSDLLLDEGAVQVGTVDVLPNYPDQFFSDVAAGGERLKVFLRNNNAGTAVVMTVVNQTPI